MRRSSPKYLVINIGNTSTGQGRSGGTCLTADILDHGVEAAKVLSIMQPSGDPGTYSGFQVCHISSLSV